MPDTRLRSMLLIREERLRLPSRELVLVLHADAVRFVDRNSDWAK
jgi:hypothetical protein